MILGRAMVPSRDLERGYETELVMGLVMDLVIFDCHQSVVYAVFYPQSFGCLQRNGSVIGFSTFPPFTKRTYWDYLKSRRCNKIRCNASATSCLAFCPSSGLKVPG